MCEHMGDVARGMQLLKMSKTDDIYLVGQQRC